jgi:hypothetical protein
MVAICKIVQHKGYTTRGKKAPTFQCNNSADCKLIWHEPDRDLSNAYIEKRSPDGQGNTGVGPNVATVRNQSASENDDRAT